MFIGLQKIKTLLDMYDSSISICGYSCCVTGYEMLEHALQPYTTRLLYLAEIRNLPALKPIENMNLLLINPDREDFREYIDAEMEKLNIVEVYTDEVQEIRLLLRDFFNKRAGEGYLANSMLDNLYADRSIQDMLDDVKNAFDNPVFVFDAGFNLIAATWDLGNTHEVSRAMMETGHYTDRDFEIIMKATPSHSAIMKSDRPVRVFHHEYGFEQLVCSIDSRTNVGTIIINSVYHPFDEMDIFLLTMFKSGVAELMQKDAFIRNNKGFPYEYFIRDLLDQKNAVSDKLPEYFDYVQKEFSDHMYCLVIETAKAPGDIETFFVRNQLEKLFVNVKTLMYNGEIIALFCLQKDEHFSEEKYDTIHTICQKSKIYAGISNSFRSLSDLYDYYKQAIRTFELGMQKKNAPGLFRYKDYYKEHIAGAFMQKVPLEVYCHPKLKVLLEYDSRHSAQLSYSLYMYLIHERNIAAASQAMFIHRNTLIYRLKRINELVDIDYDSYEERHYLELSYEIIRISDEAGPI